MGLNTILATVIPWVAFLTVRYMVELVEPIPITIGPMITNGPSTSMRRVPRSPLVPFLNVWGAFIVLNTILPAIIPRATSLTVRSTCELVNTVHVTVAPALVNNRLVNVWGVFKVPNALLAVLFPSCTILPHADCSVDPMPTAAVCVPVLNRLVTLGRCWDFLPLLYVWGAILAPNAVVTGMIPSAIFLNIDSMPVTVGPFVPY